MKTRKGRLFTCVLVVLLLLSTNSACLARQFVGICERVIDGDTIKVAHDGTVETIRLSGIDAPEKHQTFGAQSKAYASQCCFGALVSVVGDNKDRYGRTIGEVFLADGTDLNRKMVKYGFAWWYRKYAPHDLELALLEQRAEQDHLGLWSSPGAIPPWVYRKMTTARSVKQVGD